MSRALSGGRFLCSAGGSGPLSWDHLPCRAVGPPRGHTKAQVMCLFPCLPAGSLPASCATSVGSESEGGPELVAGRLQPSCLVSCSDFLSSSPWFWDRETSTPKLPPLPSSVSCFSGRAGLVDMFYRCRRRLKSLSQTRISTSVWKSGGISGSTVARARFGKTSLSTYSMCGLSWIVPAFSAGVWRDIPCARCVAAQ